MADALKPFGSHQLSNRLGALWTKELDELDMVSIVRLHHTFFAQSLLILAANVNQRLVLVLVADGWLALAKYFGRRIDDDLIPLLELVFFLADEAANLISV